MIYNNIFRTSSERITDVMGAMFQQRIEENTKGINNGLIPKWFSTSQIQFKCRRGVTWIAYNLKKLVDSGEILKEKRDGINYYCLADVPWGMHVDNEHIQMIKK